MSEQSEKLDLLRDEIDEYVKDTKELRCKFDELMKEIKPLYDDIRYKQEHLFRLQDEVKRYGIVKGHLNLKYLIELLEAIKTVDKTPSYESYYPKEQVTENMKNKNGELPPEYSCWFTPRDITEKLLALINQNGYEVPYDQLYYKEERR
jgi:predicted nuclease with TOPRIM domain